jgi:para-nitrobenzyl esterase
VTALASTRSGTVVGTTEGDTIVFRGIPFAAPPVGALRWQAPVREAAWTGERDTSVFGAVAVQGQMMLEQMMGGEPPRQSEDCLSLNVWTRSTDGARPVMVWIHGGAFMFGSGSTPWYDGTRFVQHGDVVVVTINYRLGPFGYLYLSDLFDGMEHSGNLGVLDQVAALEWVRDSIGGFGGDPNDVTIFGESAGGGSVGTLLGTPAARGLFRKAIVQSGAASWGLDRSVATDNARQLIAELGIEAGDRDALMAAPTQAILDASAVLGSEITTGTLPFAPVHDAEVLPVPPLEAIAAGMSAGVHVLCGTNFDEMTLFAIVDPALASIDDDGIADRLAKFDRTIDAASLLRTYRDHRVGASTQDIWIAMSTDGLFRIPSIRLVEAHLAHGPAWMYLFTWASPAFGGVLKSTHALEIPFVFDNLDQPGVPLFTGDGAERQGIADRMHAAWLAFVGTGSPQHADTPAWPQYDLDRRPTMQIDAEWQLLDDPMGDERKFWEHETAL